MDRDDRLEGSLAALWALELASLQELYDLVADDDATGMFTPVGRAEVDTVFADRLHAAGLVWERGYVAFEGGAA